jgi:hypothetical protein
MPRQTFEVIPIPGDDDGIHERRRCHHERVERHRCIDLRGARQSDARGLRDVEGGHDLARRQDLLARVRPPAPPFRHDGQRYDDAGPADANQTEEARRPFLSTLGGDQGAGVKDVPGNHATFDRPRRFFEPAISRWISASIRSPSALLGTGIPWRFK